MKDQDLPTPVLEVGGTHVTAALVQGGDGAGQSGDAEWRVVAGSVLRRDLDAHAGAGAILDALASAATALGCGHNGTWGVALPGPFDYVNGVARYEHVGKFDNLKGVNVRAGLADRLGTSAKSITFLNDADSFGIGQAALGAAGESGRAVCITLGTGVGSAFLADGVPVKSGADVPPDGSCYLLDYRGRPLEDTVSRRAIRRAYAAAKAVTGSGSGKLRTGRSGSTASGPAASGSGRPDDHDDGAPDVREIAEASRAGDAVAAAVLEDAFAAVGEAAGPYLRRFGAEVLILGGSMTASWDIVEPALRKGLAAAAAALAALPIRKAERAEEAGLIGAACWARGRATHAA